VVQRVKTDEDIEGNCYDWYIIEKHNRVIDKTKLVKGTLDEIIAQMLEA